MEKLTAGQQQQVKKMSDERLKTKLVSFGYDEELVWTWEREELLNRFAEVMVAGGKPREPTVDLELEKQRLAFEMKKWEQEIELERQKAEQEATIEKQKMQLDMEKMEFEKKKAKNDYQMWLADREERKRKEEADERRREEDLKLQKEKDRKVDQIKNDNAAKARKYGDAIRGSIIAMGSDPLDATVFFKRAEQLFKDYDIPKEFQAKVVSPFLSSKARAILAKLSSDVTNNYESMKAAILRELQLSSNVYIERFNMYKPSDETYVSFASKLRSLLDYYLESRCVTGFDDLCELLVCDRI